MTGMSNGFGLEEDLCMKGRLSQLVHSRRLHFVYHNDPYRWISFALVSGDDDLDRPLCPSLDSVCGLFHSRLPALVPIVSDKQITVAKF